MLPGMKYRLGFIGAGNMAEALARGAIRGGVVEASQILAGDPSPERRRAFAEFGVQVTADPTEVAAGCEQVVMAVKPQVFPNLGQTLRRLDRERQVVISIMAGVRSSAIEAAAGGPTRVIRVMPNTPLMAGQGMSGVAVCGAAMPGDAALCEAVLGSCGRVAAVDEADLDAVTAVSGSGPAYVFLLAEAMMAAAAEVGLAGQERLFVQQTLIGAAAMLSDDGDTAAQLREKVTSPGGTTHAAVETLRRGGFEKLLGEAITAARDRSVELGG